MRKLRIVVLIHKGLLPPNSKKGFKEKEIEEWRVEYDVISTLNKLGHTVKPVEMYGELTPLREALDEFKPHIAFNLLEEFYDFPVFDQQVVSYLELKKIPYTGCNPRGFIIAKDKALSKKILFYHDIKTPEFKVFPSRKKAKENHKYEFPLFVKSISDEGSVGITKKSLVRSFKELKERVEFIHKNSKTAAIAEQFVEGREIYVGIIGNEALTVFTPWELHFTKDKNSTPIATSNVKWSKKHQKRLGVVTKAAKLPVKSNKELINTSKKIFKILMLSGYARLDFRITPNNGIYFIEANANPYLAKDEDFAQSALHFGHSYKDLLKKIINTGLNNSKQTFRA
ncbi:MAG TPA: hypothetical protein VLM39_03260 [Ignavibacteriaceae bacterium]|nr:hypothetical protein [Ignavibacteriaceae bacterium]